MLKLNLSYELLLLAVTFVVVGANATPRPHITTDASTVRAADERSGGLEERDCRSPLEMSLYCRGARAIRNVVHNLSKTDKPIVIFRGLEIVPSQNMSQLSPAQVDDSVMGRFSEYLRTHELNVKFSDLLMDESVPGNWAADVKRLGLDVAAESEEGRKKDKGQGVLLAMAMMMGKMMAILGLGGIGALAMKALGVAMMALLMAGLVGLKSLSQHGGESSHSVSYVTGEGHHHKRRRRSATPEQQLAYSGWLRRLSRST